MGVKIWNLAGYKLVLPEVGLPALGIGEGREYPNLEYDSLLNNSSIRKLKDTGKIKLKNLDDMDIQFADGWEDTPKLTLGDYQVWLDANGKPRYSEGPPTSDDDGEPFGGMESLEQVYSDVAVVAGVSFLTVRNTLFTERVNNRSLGTWDSVYKYCYWSFWWHNAGVWSSPQQFPTEDAFFTWLEAHVPSVGTSYASVFKLRAYETIDTADVFPQQLRHRNSLVASILGKGNWTRRAVVDRSGASYSFNRPAYYLNFYGELGQRFVQADFGVLPPTNNDGVIWHTQRNRTAWNFPKVGQVIDLSALPNNRGAVWDNGIGNWVTPAPAASYSFRTPFLLYEAHKSKMLAIDTGPTPEWREFALDGVAALVFPVQNNSNADQHAYVVYPHGADSFITEYFNLLEYELCLKLEYRHTYSPIYLSVPTPQQSDSGEHLMWSHFPNGGGASILLQREYGGQRYRSSADTNALPTKVWVARRNKTTGARSQWYPLYTIRRRIPHASMRIEPARPRV